MEFDRKSKEHLSFALTSEEIHFKQNVILDLYGVSHDELTKSSLDELSVKLNDYDFVVVESDEQLLKNDPIEVWNNSNQDLINLSSVKGLPLVCCDPAAETSSFFYIEFGAMSAELLLLSNTALSMMGEGNPRRQFLKILGMSGLLLLLRGSFAGEAFEGAVRGFDGFSKHPSLSDSVSYNEFRNSAALLGINQLVSQDLIHPNSRGIQLIGGWHADDYRGYLVDQEVDLNTTADVYRSNLFTQYLKKTNEILPTVRVWSTDSAGQYNLNHYDSLNIT